MMIHLSDSSFSDLEKVKELSDIQSKAEVVRKTIKLRRLLFEKQYDGYVVLLRKDEDIVELKPLF